MAAVLVPAYGEAFQPYSPRVKKVSFGFATDNDVVVTSTGDYKLFTPSHGVLVTDMRIKVVTAFNISTITIGDTDVDGYFAGSDVVFTGVTTQAKSMQHTSTAFGVTAPAYRDGRFYSTDAGDTMAINAQVTAAAVTAGKAYAYIFYVDTALV